MPAKKNDGLTAKQRFFNKRYEEAPLIDCACGCGEKLKAMDRYARPVTYVNGHNARLSEDGTNMSPWEIEKRWRVKNPDKVRRGKNRFRRKRKIMAIDLKGGECVFCGLVHDGKNTNVFDFHHLDPEYKEDNISRMLTNKAWVTTVKELEQCVLACSNCHRMVHSEDEDNFEEDLPDDYHSETNYSGRGISSDQNLD